MAYKTATDNLLQRSDKPVMIEQEQTPGAPISLQQFERLLIPLLNYVRKEQGKRPVIVPKG